MVSTNLSVLRVLPPFAVLWEWLTVFISTLQSVLQTVYEFLRIRKFATTFPGPKPLPIVGNLFDLLKLNIPGITQYAINTGSVYSTGVVWFGPIPIYFVCHPRDVERVLSHPKTNSKPFLYHMFDNWLGTGLIASKDELFRRHFKIISPSFHMKVLETFVPVYNKKVDELFKTLDTHAGGPDFDFLPMAGHLALDIICEAAMGFDMNREGETYSTTFVENLKFVEIATLERALRPWLHAEWIFRLSPLGRRQERALAAMRKIRNRVIEDRRRRLHEDALNENSASVHHVTGEKRRLAFLDHLLLQQEAGENISDQEIADEVDTIMLAGHDTNAALLAFGMHALAHRQDIQDKMVKELESIFDPSLETIEITPEALSSMHYIEMVVKEVMRLHPPVPVVGRVVKEDIPLATRNLIIPAGSNVAIGIAVTHKDPDCFPDPEEFDPERFLPENVKDRHSYAYLPFCAGQRTCVGKRLALMEAKAVMAKLLWSYNFLPVPDFKYILSWGITFKSENGIRLRIEKRQRSY